MRTIGRKARGLVTGILPPSRGVGPLLQRDYWAVIAGCRLKPSEVASLVAERFCEFPPEDLVVFRRTDGTDAPLEVGDELEVDIRAAGRVRVRVLHRDGNSLTIGTLEGHPEAGRITFGAYRNDLGDVIFHIRSRARSASGKFYVGFLALGEAMQTNTWTDFVNCVASTVGDGVLGYVQAEKARLNDAPEDADALGAPTFIARGD